MKKLAVLFLLAGGCAPPAYYVANVYQANGALYTERCALDGGRHGDKPDPDHCRFDPVGELPPDIAAKVAPMPPPMAPPPAAPTPPPPPTT